MLELNIEDLKIIGGGQNGAYGGYTNTGGSPTKGPGHAHNWKYIPGSDRAVGFTADSKYFIYAIKFICRIGKNHEKEEPRKMRI